MGTEKQASSETEKEVSQEVFESTNPGRISKASVSDSTNNIAYESTDSRTSTTMRSSRPVGTSNFMAPELIEGLPYGPPIDWWACGVTIYECTTREKLFGSGSRTTILRATASRSASPPTRRLLRRPRRRLRRSFKEEELKGWRNSKEGCETRGC